MSRKTAAKKPAPKKAPRPSAASLELATWNRKAERAVEDLIDFAFHFPALRKRGPKTAEWRVGVRLVGTAEMKKLNAHYRKKDYATDVLSFTSPEPFRSMGYLGELAIALPVLKRQAREHRHSAEAELWILLTHGLLHLLGMDHEQGAKASKEQSTWEARLLAFTDIPHERSLIGRAK
jgi:rRNA maturation RNase YbeY